MLLREECGAEIKALVDDCFFFELVLLFPCSYSDTLPSSNMTLITVQ
jgi:hypothetical protein